MKSMNPTTRVLGWSFGGLGLGLGSECLLKWFRGGLKPKPSPTQIAVLLICICIFPNQFVFAKHNISCEKSKQQVEGMENGPKRRRRELEPTVLHKVGDVISAINEAKHVDQLICALHSLAVRLFPLDSSAFSGRKISYSFCLASERTEEKNRKRNFETFMSLRFGLVRFEQPGSIEIRS